MHDRGDCNMFSAIITALQIRKQLNSLEEVGIDRKAFYELLDSAKNEPVIQKG